VESYKNGKYIGYDQFFNSMEIESETNLVGDWIRVEKYIIKDKINVSNF
jgi:hypothetical protein